MVLVPEKVACLKRGKTRTYESVQDRYCRYDSVWTMYGSLPSSVLACYHGSRRLTGWNCFWCETIKATRLRCGFAALDALHHLLALLR